MSARSAGGADLDAGGLQGLGRVVPHAAEALDQPGVDPRTISTPSEAATMSTASATLLSVLPSSRSLMVLPCCRPARFARMLPIQKNVHHAPMEACGSVTGGGGATSATWR